MKVGKAVLVPDNGRQLEALIEVEDLAAGYGDQVILEHVSFRVRRGEVLAILGGSGCGKSTLLKHLIGLLPPLAGRIRLAGDDFTAATGEARLRLLRQFGVLFQAGALFGSMSLLENVRLPLEEFTGLPREAADLVALMKLELVGLKPFAHHLPAEVSGGMQKRAALARAMALDPAILFLDEPSAGLDPVTSAALDALVRRLAEVLGITFVVVTHELPSIFAVADRVLFLDRTAKGVIAEGDPRTLRDACPDPRVRRFFRREADNGDPTTPTAAGTPRERP